MMRPRPAPNAMRSAISFVRAAPRTRNKLATFAHAISSTKITAPKSTRISGCAPPAKASRTDCSATPNWSFSRGDAFHFRARLRKVDSGRESPHHRHVAPRSPFLHVRIRRGKHAGWLHNVCLVVRSKIGRQHANYRVAASIEADGPPDNIRISAQ